MVAITLRTGDIASVITLRGSVSGPDQVDDLADQVLGRFTIGRPLVLDITALRVESPDDLAWLVLRLEAAPGWSRFRLVDERLDVRRLLRELCRRLPILPDVSTALHDTSNGSDDRPVVTQSSEADQDEVIDVRSAAPDPATADHEDLDGLDDLLADA